MKTYNTYQEAKIANPESDIFVNKDGVFRAIFKSTTSHFANGWKLCNPADYCMTVEKFLTDGHKFVEGDFAQNHYGAVAIDSENIREWNHQAITKCDRSQYILRAAALENQMNIDNLATQTPEEKEALDPIDTTPHQYEMSKFSGKPRTKVEYVKCEFSREWEAVKYYNEEGELFVIDCNGNYSNVNDISGAWYEVVCKNYDSTYRRIEAEIDERQEFIDVVASYCNDNGYGVNERFLGSIFDSNLVKLVESN